MPRSILSAAAIASAVAVANAGFAEDTCDKADWLGPSAGNSNPTGRVRCCAGKYEGGKAVASCDTSSCVNNFGQKNLDCFNYGSPQNGKGKNAGSNPCPYTEADEAYCDTSRFTDKNGGVECRDQKGNNHCLGYVVCGWGSTKGKGPCSWGAGVDQICVYNGNSENWKVCGGSSSEDSSGDSSEDSSGDSSEDSSNSACGEVNVASAANGDVYRCSDNGKPCQVNSADNRGKWTYTSDVPDDLVFDTNTIPTSADGTWANDGASLTLDLADGPDYHFPHCCDCN